MSKDESILIIDDQRDNVSFLNEHILKPGGYQVSLARDGETGLQQALKERPDLILLNLTVPAKGGLQVLQELRRSKSDIPVILMTFHGSEEAAVRAFRLGAKDYIIKPYRIEEMQQAIERGLTESRLRFENSWLSDSLSQVNRQMERRLKELSVMASVGKLITAFLDEDRLLTRVVEAAVYITGAEEGFLLLVDEESGELYMRAAQNLGKRYARGFRLKVKDSLAGQVVQSGKPVVITHSGQEDRFKVKTGYLVKSLLHVPLKAGETVLGVLSVDHMIEDRTFDNHDLSLLSALADYAAIALENSRLHARLEQELEQPKTEMLATSADLTSTEELTHFLAGLASHREEVLVRIREGRAVLSDVREQLGSLERGLDGIASQEQWVSRAGAVATSPLPVASALELSSILDSMVDGVLVVDENGRVVLANKAGAILGSDLVGKMVEDVCDDPRWAKTYRIVQTAAQLEADRPGSEINSASTPLLVAQKMIRASFLIKSSAGQTPPGIVIVLRDISAEREAQRAKDSFVASVSQELRTPMTSIMGYTGLLLGGSVGPLGETQGKFINRILANAQRIDSLLNDLVGMTIIDSRQLEVRPETMDLATAIHEAAGVARAEMGKRGQVLELNLDPNLPYVQAGPDAIYHVLTALLQNAYHCSRAKSHIVLRAEKMRERDDLYAVVSVRDAGGGIAPEDQKKVFNRFYRADNPIVPGLGDPNVGLPLVKVLVEAHGGRIWLDSVPGVGSIFTFILPVHHGVSPRR